MRTPLRLERSLVKEAPKLLEFATQRKTLAPGAALPSDVSPLSASLLRRALRAEEAANI